MAGHMDVLDLSGFDLDRLGEIPPERHPNYRRDQANIRPMFPPTQRLGFATNMGEVNPIVLEIGSFLRSFNFAGRNLNVRHTRYNAPISLSGIIYIPGMEKEASALGNWLGGNGLDISIKPIDPKRIPGYGIALILTERVAKKIASFIP